MLSKRMGDVFSMAQIQQPYLTRPGKPFMNMDYSLILSYWIILTDPGNKAVTISALINLQSMSSE